MAFVALEIWAGIRPTQSMKVVQNTPGFPGSVLNMDQLHLCPLKLNYNYINLILPITITITIAFSCV